MSTAMVSCLDTSDGTAPQFDVGFIDNFKEGFGNWKGGVADVPVDTLDDMEFEFVRDTIAEITSRDNNSIRITSNNPQKDAFVFITKQLDSLNPNSRYLIDFNIELKVSLEEDTSGQFDPKMYFKVGASKTEPDTVHVDANSYLGYEGYALNLDKGNNKDGGSDIKFLGSMEVPKDNKSPYIASATGTGLNLNITTDADGKFWMIFGIDSEVPFKMSFYFNSINIFLKEQ